MFAAPRRRLVAAGVAVIAAGLAAGCARGPRSETLQPYTSARHGFTLERPASWAIVETDDGRRIWFLPQRPALGETPETSAAEFLVVMTLAEPGPLPEHEVRRLAMTLLPMHGVSGFQQTEASTAQVGWYRFELTGSTRGREWASVGFLITGTRRLHYVVCAAPLNEWRERQKTCDRALRSFTPGDVSK
jgi:hypothetical protein